MSTATVNRVATGTQVVQARNVSKIFKRDAFEVKALDNVSIAFRPGEVLALVGENGAGKSTMMRILEGVFGPDTAPGT